MTKRIRIRKRVIGEVIIDHMAYSENKGSKNARKIIEKSEEINIEIWYDKHYVSRVLYGDDNGTKREGIDEEIIQELVSSSIKHLIYYSFKVKNFVFINFVAENNRGVRIVLQKEGGIEILNVVAEFHHISDNKYEVTVFTAMVANDFRLSDGQFAVLVGRDNSGLFKYDNKKMVQIDLQ